MSRLLVYLTLFCAFEAMADFDPELAGSLKCVNLFRQTEHQHRIPADTLYSISLNETGRIHSVKKIKLSWPWAVNVEGKGYFFDTKREAVSFVKRQLAQGKESIDVGCMQVNLKHHPDAFESVEEAFEPEANITYGARFLRSKYEQLGSWHKAIAHYHSATESLGIPYKNNVIKIASNIGKYKDPLRQYKAQKTYSRASERSYVKKPNSAALARRYKSNMMVPIPRTS